MNTYSVAIENINSAEAHCILEELSEVLEKITGNSGKNSFDITDINNPKAVFVIARDQFGEAVGCGVLRPLSTDIAEIKRVYSRTKKAGIGKEIVNGVSQRIYRVPIL